MLKVQTRHQSGLIEAAMRAHVADRTDWRRMLRGAHADLDLVAKRDELLALNARPIAELCERCGPAAVQTLCGEQPMVVEYPVLEYPAKVIPLDLDSTPDISGTLLGIKGQYLILDAGVRKLAGYGISVSF